MVFHERKEESKGSSDQSKARKATSDPGKPTPEYNQSQVQASKYEQLSRILSLMFTQSRNCPF